VSAQLAWNGSGLVAQLEAAGAIVCYEWVGPAAEQEWAAASASERAARDAPRAMGEETFRRVCQSLGWVEQGEVFTWAGSWRNADMTDLELVRLAGPETVRGLREDFADVFGSSLAQDQADALAGAAAAVVFRLMSLDWFDRLRHMATGTAPAATTAMSRSRTATPGPWQACRPAPMPCCCGVPAIFRYSPRS